MKDRIETRVPLAPFTAYQVGGPAEYYLQPSCTQTLESGLAWARERGMPVTAIGAGTNLLVSDDGVEGLVIHLKAWRGVEVIDDAIVEVRAGESIAALAWQMARRGWSGLEWAVGVPGSVGGAVVMNAGAHGAQMSDSLESIEVLTETGERRRVPAAELQFAYRSSRLQQTSWLVLSARLRLLSGHDPTALIARLEEYNAYRHRTQPSGIPNCGSVFRNPPGHKAGWLIEQTGLKGLRIGGAEVAEKHANFILNRGGASARDILALMDRVRQRVRERWDVWLEPEVRLLGHESLT